MNSRIYLLAFGTFAVGTEGYVIAGVLPEVAADVHASVALCGQLVTVFALVYALAGPPLIALFHKVPPKTLLVGAAIGFALSNVLAALADDFAVLTVARVAAAMTAALFAAPAASAAAALCKPEDLPHAIAVTASGNALALTIGAPIGTVVGSVFGWRGAFLFVTGLAVVTAVGVALWLPTVPVPAATHGRLNLLRSVPIRWGLVTTFGLFMAAYCTYTYLSPIASQAADFGSTGVAALMIVFGAGGFLAGRTIGRVLKVVPIVRVLTCVLLVMTGLFVLLAVLTDIRATGVARIAAFPLLFGLGAAWWSGGITQQTRIAGHAPTQRSQAIGLHFSAQFLGVALGGAVGGLAVGHSGPVGVPIVSAAVAAAALLSVRMATPAASGTAGGTASATTLAEQIADDRR